MNQRQPHIYKAPYAANESHLNGTPVRETSMFKSQVLAGTHRQWLE